MKDVELRDYFAGLALNALLPWFIQKYQGNTPEGLANLCYELADAMMAKRQEASPKGDPET